MTTTLESLDAKLDEVLALLKRRGAKAKTSKSKKLGTRAYKIVEFLDKNPGEWNIYQIATNTGEKEQIKRVTWTVRNLAKRKAIARVGAGTYSSLPKEIA